MVILKFEWDETKSRSSEIKHGIDFESATELWNDNHRIEILTLYPIENRSILIGKINGRMWTAVFTRRGNAVRIISVRCSRKKEVNLYDQAENS